MEFDQNVVDRLAELFASHIEEYRKARDDMDGRAFGDGPKILDLADVAEATMNRANAISSSDHPIDYFQLHEAVIDSMLAVVNTIGGIKLARQICDALEDLDDKESSEQVEPHYYVRNFDVLATGIIDGWVS